MNTKRIPMLAPCALVMFCLLRPPVADAVEIVGQQVAPVATAQFNLQEAAARFAKSVDPDAGGAAGQVHPPVPPPEEALPGAAPPPTESKSIRNSAKSILPPAITFEGTTSGAPPDTNGAAGPDHIVTVLNFLVAVQDKSGALLQSIGLNQFFSGLGISGTFDPKVIYDPHGERFIIVCCAERRSPNSSVALAISESSNPLEGWRTWRFDGDANDAIWADFPNIGVTKDYLTFTSNMISVGADSLRGINIWVVDRVAAMGGGPFTTSLIFDNRSNPTYVPALTFDDNIATQYIINTNFGQLGFLSLHTITGPPDAPVYTDLDIFPEGTPWNSGLRDAPQLGTTSAIETNDPRLHNAVIRNGSLWTVHTAGLPAMGIVERCTIQWWEIDVREESPTFGETLQTGSIDHFDSGGISPELHYYYPSIAVNKFNDVLIGFTGSSPTIYAGAFYAFRNTDTPPGQMEGVFRYRPGIGSYTGNRWGDYSATSVDPADDTSMWTIQEYAIAGGRYGTSWAMVTTMEVAGGRITPEPGPPFIVTGLPLRLIAPPGTDYIWQFEGSVIPNAVDQELAFAAAALSDSGVYLVEYTDPERGRLTSQPYQLEVASANEVPGPASWALAIALLGIAITVLRRKRIS